MTEAWLDGDARAGLDTPAVIVDLDRLDANIARMAATMRERGMALRPHAKTHKSLAVARRQLAAGAVATFRGAASPRVLVEIDSGGARSGVSPHAAGALARQAVERGLDVIGVFTHAGQGYADPARRSDAAGEEVAGLAAAADSLRREGIEPTVISAGSTPTAALSAREPVTEERPGTYVFGDRQQTVLAGEPTDIAESVALVVAATVVSHGSRGGFLVDAGAKIVGQDVAPLLAGHGAVLGYPAAVLTRLNDHHGIAEAPAGTARPAIGELILIVPNHVCPVVNLVDELLAVRGGRLVDRWPVDARGRNG